MAEVRFLLLETAMGYLLFERQESDEVGATLAEAQQAVKDYGKFSLIVKLKAKIFFRTAEEALENINDVSEGMVTPLLKSFLEPNVPASKAGKKAKVAMGVSEHALGKSIQEQLNIACVCNDLTAELLRGVRVHATKFVSVLKPGDIEKAQLGLAHSYSRSKVKFDVNRADKHIIQSIAILDTLDKDINTFAMRVREWYSWHFPELVKIVNDNYMYARLVRLVKKRESLTAESKEAIEAITMDATKAQEVLDASKHSMGMDISEVDLLNIHAFAERVIKLAEYRTSLQDYLHAKMGLVAPNLQMLIGDAVGARLISHAGSLTNLAKYPASTVQILGAEKALFRALKTKHDTPKYGLIYHASLVGQAQPKHKGKISRVLAAKCALSIRVDALGDTDEATVGFDGRLKVEERLRQLEGKAPLPKEERVAPIKQPKVTMAAATNGGSYSTAGDAVLDGDAKKEKKKKKEKKDEEEDEPKAKKAKKDKGDKEEAGKKKKRDDDDDEKPKKKKKEKKDE